MSWRHLPLTGILLAGALLGVALAQVGPGDFAETILVEPVGDSPLQMLVVPPEVYRAARRPNLADVRVFNTDGEEVPYAHLGARQRQAPRRERVAPSFFTLGDATELSEELRVRIATRSSGATVTLESRPGEAPPARPAAYLIDASELTRNIVELQLEWAEDTRDFVTTVAVEASSDLAAWQRLGSATVIAQLTRESQSLQRNLVTLPAITAPYLRLVRTRGDPLPRLSRIDLEVLVEGSEPELLWIRAQAKPTGEPHVYLFDSGGFFPVERVRLALPQENTLAQSQLHSAAQSEGPWVRRFDGLLYRMRFEEQSLAPDPLDLPLTRHRYWRLTIDPAGGGLGPGQPDLELGYAEERLLFVTRGEAPFVLAYGHPEAAEGSFTTTALLTFLPPSTSLEALPPAQLGSIIRPEATAVPTPPQPLAWQRVLLWATLVLGVATLGWMATRLIRTLADNPSSAEQSSEKDRQA